MPSHQTVSAIIEGRRQHWSGRPLHGGLAPYGLFEIHTDYRIDTCEYRLAFTITDRRTGWQAARQITLDRYAIEGLPEAAFCDVLDDFIEHGKAACEEYFRVNNPTPPTADHTLGRRMAEAGAPADVWGNMLSAFGMDNEELARMVDSLHRSAQNISKTEAAKKKPAQREVRLEKKKVSVPEHSTVRRIRIRLI